MPIALTARGWSPHFEEAFTAQAEPGLLCGRVCREERERHAVLTAARECHARLSGSYRFRLADRCALPVVGD